MSNNVRAKFKVVSYTTSLQGDQKTELRTVNLVPVYSDDPASENHMFWKYTPAGKIELGTINPSAWEKLVLGNEYYIDFVPV